SIIGRNGAGKSTLLKVLSRITEPTMGKIRINGRIASLLEVGTGFHPELTGRENIFLNGAILGMSRAEIKAKFDEIVAFSEVEKFLDTPVKRYSSGMYVGLAFSVAAHLEPEILVVDEVLAVGDVEFQKKCLGKMSDVSKEGRTILFVSHNMNAIEQLCNQVMLLDNGKLAKKSMNVREVIHEYLAYDKNDTNQSEWINLSNRFGDRHFQLTYFGIQNDKDNAVTQAVKNNDEIKVVIEGKIEQLDKALQVGYALYDEENILLYWSIFNDSAEKNWPEVKKGSNKFISQIPKRFLNEGTYRLEVIAALYFRYWIIEPQKNSPSIFLTVQGGLSDSPYWMIRRPGILAPEL
ncbi:MAG TPA: ATP-binding cassette domain-containing protein, partial [Saprospiraceae bacterium]|nr:ATP-binding cassette domain-containing protein [Saprospiraceae bacterium]